MNNNPNINSMDGSGEVRSRRAFLSLLGAGGAGVALSSCTSTGELDPHALGAATAVTGVLTGIGLVSENDDLTRIAGFATVALGALTLIAYYQASERQRRYVENKRTRIKSSAQKYDSRYVAVKTTSPSKSQKRTYSSTGKKLIKNKEKPKSSTHLMVYDTKTDQIVGNKAYEVANPEKGKKVQLAGQSAIYAGV